MCPGTLKTGSIFCCSCLQVDGSIKGGEVVGGGGGGGWCQVGEMQGLNILKFILPKVLKSKLFDVVILFSLTCHQISLV